ncbi:MAG TPA: hypothetical protein VI861_00155 [Rickettsiales bacterium]|nr:hypothetical protein [Rickettsiales bacterium]
MARGGAESSYQFLLRALTNEHSFIRYAGGQSHAFAAASNSGRYDWSIFDEIETKIKNINDQEFQLLRQVAIGIEEYKNMLQSSLLSESDSYLSYCEGRGGNPQHCVLFCIAKKSKEKENGLLAVGSGIKTPEEIERIMNETLGPRPRPQLITIPEEARQANEAVISPQRLLEKQEKIWRTQYISY